MKNITLTEDLRIQIYNTESQLAIKHGQEIFLVTAIKEGRNRVYIEMKNHSRSTCRNLRTTIKQHMEFITPAGELFTPKKWVNGMFILDDGRLISTGYTTVANLELHGSYTS